MPGTDSTWYLLHNNLGIALEGQECFAEAAQAYLEAAEICPDDRRALRLLERLIATHPEIETEVPGFFERIECSRRAAVVTKN